MEVAANCSLRVKRPLLDPRFEGYKLSLEPLPCYQLELDAGGKRRRPLALFSSSLSDAKGQTLPAFSSFPTRGLLYGPSGWGGHRVAVSGEGRPSRTFVGATFSRLFCSGTPGRHWAGPLGSGAGTQVLLGLRPPGRPGLAPAAEKAPNLLSPGPGASSVNLCVGKPRLFGGPQLRLPLAESDPFLKRGTPL